MSSRRNVIILGYIVWAFTMSVAYFAGKRSATNDGYAVNQETPAANTPLISVRNGRSSMTAPLSDPVTSLLDSLALPKNPHGPETYQEIITRLNRKHALAAIDALSEQSPSPIRNQAYVAAMARLAELDPLTALEIAAATPGRELKLRSQIASLKAWGSLRPEEALAFVSDPANGEKLPKEATRAVWGGLAKGDPLRALSFVETHGGSQEHASGVREVLKELYQDNHHERLIEWTTGLPQGNLREQAAEAIVSQWARYDASAAKEWLAANPDLDQPGAQMALASAWVREDPEAAVTWAAGLTKGPQHSKVLDQVVKYWLQADRDGAGAWLASQEPSPELDNAVARYSREVVRYDPAGTMPWAESITEPKLRHETMKRVASTWRKMDPEGFQGYMHQHQDTGVFSEKEVRKLMGAEKATKSAEKLGRKLQKQERRQQPKVKRERNRKKTT